MSGKYENIVEPLRKIKEDIDAFGLNQPDELKEVCDELERLAGYIPENMPELSRLLLMCIRELRAISKKRAADPLASVDAIFESLSALEHYLSDHPSREEFLREAVHLMDNLSNNPSGKDGEDDMYGDDFLNASLNDAASLLLQIGPEDFDELERLGELLESIGGDEACVSECFEVVIHALQKVQSLIEKSRAGTLTSIPDNALEEIEALVESAMGSASGSPTESRRKPEPAAGIRSPVHEENYMPVITSYSIHYTKLYEVARQPDKRIGLSGRG